MRISISRAVRGGPSAVLNRSFATLTRTPAALRAGADPTVAEPSLQYTALHAAAARGHAEIAKQLVALAGTDERVSVQRARAVPTMQ